MEMIHDHSSAKVLQAVTALRNGNPVLLHDSPGRENEVDIVLPAIYCTPESIEFLRNNAGGLICSAIGKEVAARIGIPFMHDILANAAVAYPVLSSVIETATPYGGRPAFSISLNHRKSFTGVTDNDRSATIKAIGRLAEIVSGEEGDAAEEFASTLKSPGHVPLLIEADGSLSERRGHTELSIRLMRVAGLPPASVVCEMLDGKTHRSLTLEDASRFADEKGLVLLEGNEIL